MEMSDETRDKLDELVAITTRALTKRYWKYLPAEEIRQAVAEFVWRKRNKLAEYLQQEDRPGWAAASLAARRAGDRYCRKVKADRLGYSPRDEFFYSKALVQEMIKYSCTGVAPKAEQIDIKPPKSPAEGGNLNAMLFDVEQAMALLEPDDRSVLYARYGDDVSSEVLAQERQVTRQTIDNRLDRLVTKLINTLGSASPY